jgi:hypothetical protein
MPRIPLPLTFTIHWCTGWVCCTRRSGFGFIAGESSTRPSLRRSSRARSSFQLHVSYALPEASVARPVIRSARLLCETRAYRNSGQGCACGLGGAPDGAESTWPDGGTAGREPYRPSGHPLSCHPVPDRCWSPRYMLARQCSDLFCRPVLSFSALCLSSRAVWAKIPPRARRLTVRLWLASDTAPGNPPPCG